MRCSKEAVLCLTAIGLAFCSAPSAQAAVATSGIRVTGSAGAYDLSYTCAEDALSGSIVIKNSAGTVVKTIPTSTSDFLQGPHFMFGAWNGTGTNNLPVPAGNYYAEISTTGGAHSEMTLLAEPLRATNPDTGTPFDGRNFYGGDTNRNANSPFKNLYYMACANSSGSGITGVYVANVDASPNAAYTVGPNDANQWFSSSVLSDDNIALAGQSSGNVVIVSPQGQIVATYGEGKVSARTIQAFGTTAHPEIFWVIGSTVAYFPDLSAVTATSTPVTLAGSFPSSARGIVVNRDRTYMWVSGALGTTAPYAWVRKYSLQKDGTGAVTGATLDSSFTYQDPSVLTPPITYPTAANQRWITLSPDESILWFAINEGSADFAIGNSVVLGYNAQTGAYLGNAYKYTAQFNAEDVSVTPSGNIYVTTYPGQITGGTANSVGVIAPPDNGSTDVTRSQDFLVTSETNVRISNLTVKDVTYHGATITWTTNVPSDSVVNYGTSPGSYTETVTQDTAGVTTHTVNLDNLFSNQAYYFTVTSNAAGFTSATSSETNFTTHTLTISNVQVTNITDTSATVTFTTNEPGIGFVRWGYDPFSYVRHPGEIGEYVGLGQQPAPLSTTHTVLVKGLSPGKTYYYVAGSGYKIGTGPTFAGPVTYEVLTNEASFSTIGTIETTGLTLAATTSSATLGFTTNAATTATVKWGAAPDALSNTAAAGTGTTHTATLAGLAPGTTYYYQIEQTGAGLAPHTSPVSPFTTEITGGTEATITHSTLNDVKLALRSQIVLGAGGSLISLERQGLPGIPVAGPVLPKALRYTGLAASSGYLYSIGGYGADGVAVPDVYVAPINADGSFGAWTTTTPLPQERWLITNQVVAYNGFIYVVGGDLTDGTVMTTVYYAKQNADGTLGAWQTANPTPAERDLAGVVAMDGTIYVLGGESNAADDPWDTVFQARINADGSLGTWIQTRALKDGVYLHRAVANAHHVYRVGGLSDNVAANYAVADLMSVESARAMPTTALTPFLRSKEDLGNAEGDMDAAHYSMGTGLLRGKIVTVGGRVATASYHSLISAGKLQANGSVGPWATVAQDDTFEAYPINIRDNDAVAYNGVLYCGTGRVSSGGPTDFTAYIPFVADPNDSGYVFAGSLESPVIDLGGVTNLQHLTVSATGSGVSIRYRFANADGKFTDWFSPSGMDADITGGARYFQYQLVLTGNGSGTPTVNSVTLTTAVGTNPAANVILALRIAGGLQAATPAQKDALDVNTDGMVSLVDAARLLRQINGL